MSICPEKRRLTLNTWNAQAEIISKTEGNTAQVEQAVFVREFVMDRVDVVVVVDSNEAAKSCVTQPNIKRKGSANWKKKGQQISYSILSWQPKSKKQSD